MKNNPSMQTLKPAAAALAALLSLATASAQVTVYSEDFDTDNTANWLVNVAGAGYSIADFYFDYSTVGIPAAPNSAGGTTRGLKLAANLGSGGVFPSGISVSPMNFGITVNFEMRFDLWMNYIRSGVGSTEVGGAGYGTAGTAAQVAGVADSIFIGASTDGGTTADYRVYGPGVAISYQDTDHIIRTNLTTPLVYAAGGRNNTLSYYTTRFPAQPVPEAQTNLFPRQAGTVSPAGSISFKWHDVKLRKVGRYITYYIDEHLIATVDSDDATTTAGGSPAPLGGTNIHFNLYDINAGGSTDIDSTNLLFALFDNVRITDFTNVVTVEATTPTSKEGSGAPAVFTLSRSAAGDALTINYTMTGTATSGDDYGVLSGSVTFDPTAVSTNITIEVTDDAVAEASETVIFNITPDPSYVSGGSATVTIEDNEPNVLTVSSVTSQMYERTNDYCSMTVSRLGDLQAPAYTVNFAFAGTASGSDFYLPGIVTMEPGVGTTNFNISPVEDTLYEGNETVVVVLVATGQYTVGSPGLVVNTLVDATTAPEDLLFFDDFDDSFFASMWTIYTADTNGPTSDNSIAYAFDYSGLGIPPSPHGSGTTLGLLLTVNKSDLDARAAVVNMYPTDQNFSGDFALRFNMLLSVAAGTAIATEQALCGINHSGLNTNWFRYSAGGVGSPDWAFDGIFCAIGADAGAAAPGDYGLFSGPNAPATVGPNPTTLITAPASIFSTNEFKRPPYSLAGAPGSNPAAVSSPTPIWTDVELSKIGNAVTLKINNTIIISTNITGQTSGNIMLGYQDPYDSIGNTTSFVVFDNVRVVRLTGLKIGAVEDLGANIQFDFTFDLNAGPSSLKVESASVVSGPYADAGASIVQLAPGSFRATVAKSGSEQFYRIRHP